MLVSWSLFLFVFSVNRYVSYSELNHSYIDVHRNKLSYVTVLVSASYIIVCYSLSLYGMMVADLYFGICQFCCRTASVSKNVLTGAMLETLFYIVVSWDLLQVMLSELDDWFVDAIIHDTKAAVVLVFCRSSVDLLAMNEVQRMERELRVLFNRIYHQTLMNFIKLYWKLSEFNDSVHEDLRFWTYAFWDETEWI